MVHQSPSCRLACERPAVAAYLDDLATTGRKPAGIKQSVWAIGAVHRLGSQPDPTKAEIVR